MEGIFINRAYFSIRKHEPEKSSEKCVKLLGVIFNYLLLQVSMNLPPTKEYNTANPFFGSFSEVTPAINVGVLASPCF